MFPPNDIPILSLLCNFPVVRKPFRTALGCFGVYTCSPKICRYTFRLFQIRLRGKANKFNIYLNINYKPLTSYPGVNKNTVRCGTSIVTSTICKSCWKPRVSPWVFHINLGSLRRFRGTFPAAAQWTREVPGLRRGWSDLVTRYQVISSGKHVKTYENIGSGRSGNPFWSILFDLGLVKLDDTMVKNKSWK